MSLSQPIHNLHSQFSRLCRNERGGAIALVGFAIPVVIGGLALSIDTGIWYLEKRKLQQVADTASLAAVRTMTAGGSLSQQQAAAQSDAVRNGYVAGATTTFTVHSPPTSGAYTGNSHAVEVVTTKKLPTFFSTFFLTGTNTMTARSVAYQAITLGRNVEVSLMLDVSSSMNGGTEVPGVTKLKGMQDAAKSLIDIVVVPGQTTHTARVALVPYSSAINVGSAYYTAVTNQPVSGGWTTVVERSGTAAFKDDAPASGKWLGQFKTKKNSALGDYASWVKNQTSNVPSTSKVNPLTTDKVALKATIDAFTGNGTTAGHLGAAWTWYTLSPKWSGVVGAGNAANPYDAAQTSKVAVLLSDFDMNSYYESANGNSSAQTQSVCTAMKAAGVTVYTVAYGLNTSDSTAVNLWKNCASSVDTRFSTTTVDGMKTAFQAIAAAALSSAATLSPQLVE
ncbi:MAG TPA: pilus assembly protein TadG-related protein [Vineibacter sp.]|nr:pilus assembly protein TadG-related protein [Vineibacter sp.]